ncbi:uncharacterized protein DFL_000113 [Arthrobotrys flagrans]|uniref:Uncharacterized protein n=1 Tax=Arthrobotrys flagrans TaxID=97331 RepID=A0A437ADD9_ARTFL|nr:hypothetical protein DFL_000113 [Arthrobotrys flagrans]
MKKKDGKTSTSDLKPKITIFPTGKNTHIFGKVSIGETPADGWMGGEAMSTCQYLAGPRRRSKLNSPRNTAQHGTSEIPD